MKIRSGRRSALLYNPVARTLARDQTLIPRLAKQLGAQGFDCRLVPTLFPGSASDQVRREIADGCELVIAAGGDGTINEVADGMLFTGVPLAIIPCGTANVLARELRIPLKPEQAAVALNTLEAQELSIGNLQSGPSLQRSFVCMAGIGLDADIISRLNLDLKAAAGKVAYYVCGFSQVFRKLPEFEVNVDGQKHQASFALISRVRNYGGDLEIARGASLLRDDFEIVLFRGSLAFQYIPYLLGVLLKKVHRMPGCLLLRGKTISCPAQQGRKIFAQVDGELVGELPVTVEAISGALTLLVPSDFSQREQAVVAAVPTYA